MGMSIETDRVAVMRSRLGISMEDAWKALAIYDENPSLGLVYAACVVEAAAFAINVGSRLPPEEKAAARDAWNRRHAVSMAKSIVDRDPSLADIDTSIEAEQSGMQGNRQF
jgi:hypothetical protein